MARRVRAGLKPQTAVKLRAERRQLRSFGVLVGSIFSLIGLWPVLVLGEMPRLWAVVLGSGLILPALALPGVLKPLYWGWMRVGHGLSWLNMRIILGVVFYGLITPVGLFRRAFLKKDPLRRAFEPGAETYRERSQPRPRSHVHHQF